MLAGVPGEPALWVLLYYSSVSSRKAWDNRVSLYPCDKLYNYMYIQRALCATLRHAEVIHNSWWRGHVEARGILTVTGDISLLS